jgi:phosphatidylglycerol lysyltransferase
MTDAGAASPKPFWLRWKTPLMVGFYLILATVCVLAIKSALKDQSLESIGQAFQGLSPIKLGLAALLVAATYSVLVVIEAFAHREAHVRMSLPRLIFSTFTANGIAIGVGAGPLSGGAVRARLFAAWGLPIGAAGVTAASVTVISLSGGAALAGLGFALDPTPVSNATGLAETLVRGIGLAILLTLAALVIAAGKEQRGLKVFGQPVNVPHGGGASARIGVGALDWMLSASVLYVLLPEETRGGFFAFVAVFAAAHFMGMAMGTPAGLGVFDAVMLHLAPGHMSSSAILVALVIYRIVAFLTPLVLATMCLLIFEATHRGKTNSSA